MSHTEPYIPLLPKWALQPDVQWRCCHSGCRCLFWASEMRQEPNHFRPDWWWAPCGHSQSVIAPLAVRPNPLMRETAEREQEHELRGLVIPVEYHDSEDPSDEELFSRPFELVRYDARPQPESDFERFSRAGREIAERVAMLFAGIVVFGFIIGTFLAWAMGWLR